MLWHLLSLDAPSVAALWTVFAGWCAGVHLRAIDPAAMFLAVWMLYAADRLLDARPLVAIEATPAGANAVAELEERHRFHHRYRHWFLPCLVTGTVPLAYLLHHMAAPVLHLYALLAALLAGWLLLVHAQAAPFTTARRLPKEFAVGLFFPAAVFIPSVARAPALRPALLPGALLFAGVCICNCLFLYAWEHPRDRSRAHATTRFALRRLLPLTSVLIAVAGAVALLAIAAPRQTLPAGAEIAHPVAFALAPAASGAILLALHALRHRIPPLRLRALADVALLTPVLLLFPVLLQGPR